MDNNKQLYLSFQVVRIFLMGIVCTLLSTLGHAQGLSIELSIEWRRTEPKLIISPVKSDTILILPFLKITYRNLTEDDIYFVNIVEDETYPSLVTGLMNTSLDVVDRVRIHKRFDGQSFKVAIGNIWEVLDNNVNKASEHEFDIINDELWIIYRLLDLQKKLNELRTNMQLSCFSYSSYEIVDYHTAKNIVQAAWENAQDVEKSRSGSYDVRPQFLNKLIFLKRGQIYEKEFNLIGFYLLGGNFNFSISEDLLSEYPKGKNSHKEETLDYIDGYKYYCGAIMTNKTQISIE